MLKPEQVPEGVAYAAEEAWSNEATWQEIIAAALSAWPGMTYMEPDLANGIIILPLITEASDE